LLNIKIITYGNFPFGGAAANFIRNLAVGLAKNSVDVEVLLPKGHFFGNKVELETNSCNTFHNVKYRYFCFRIHPKHILGKFIDNFCGPILMNLYLIRECLRNNRIYIIKYNITFTSQLFLVFVSKITRVKLINIIPEYYEKPEKGIYKLTNWYNFYYGISLISRFADGYIVLSNFLRNAIQKLKKDAKIIVQPNIIDPSIFQNIEQGRKGLELLIGYAGTPTQKDGIIDLLESFRIVINHTKTVTLLLIGDLTNGTSVIPELEEYCRKIGIENYVQFTGLLPFEMMPILLSKCDILVLARPRGIFAEAGFPTKLGEYFAASKPVVATNVGDIGVYFKNQEQLLLAEAGNRTDIAKKLIFLINNSDQREKIGKAGYNWMIQNLEFIHVSQKVSDFLATI